jgi:hypothetical protein
MVELVKTGFFSDIKDSKSSRTFPMDQCQAIEAAIEEVPRSIFINSQNDQEIRKFDGHLAEELPGYEHEHDSGSGRNPKCKLWDNEGFDHSVDLYHPDERIAVEVEKSERKRVSDDLIKFNKDGKPRRVIERRLNSGQ